MLNSNFNFHNYISSLSPNDLELFAVESGTTSNYIKNHLIYKTKIPRTEMIDALVHAAHGEFSKSQFIAWLYDLKID